MEKSPWVTWSCGGKSLGNLELDSYNLKLPMWLDLTESYSNIFYGIFYCPNLYGV